MTAYANRSGQSDGTSWSWELRGVNARGLDLKLRLPDGLGGLESMARAALTTALVRGSITLNLRLSRGDVATALALDQAQLDRVLQALEQVQQRAFAIGVTLAQATAADVLNHRGVIVPGQAEDTDDTPLISMLQADLHVLLQEFLAMRRAEGASLLQVMTGQLDQIDTLIVAAAQTAAARRPEVQANLTAALRRVASDLAPLDPSRMLQELALLAIKSDITEEIDRLSAHVTAARALLADAGPVGRKLDFLAQEFNREANTLCAKAQSTDLTRIGLDLKAVIEQLREQVQNVE